MTNFTMSDEDWEALLLSSGILAFVGVILIVVLGLLVVNYVIRCLGLYKMAKKVGSSKAWMAWIPYVNMWLMFNLPTKEYRVLAINKVINRNAAFWIYLGISLVATSVIAVFGVIPYLGAIIVFLGDIAVCVAQVFMLYPMYKDLFLLYHLDSSAQGYAIASTIFSFFLPIVPSILMLITSAKAPREIQIEADYR